MYVAIRTSICLWHSAIAAPNDHVHACAYAGMHAFTEARRDVKSANPVGSISGTYVVNTVAPAIEVAG